MTKHKRAQTLPSLVGNGKSKKLKEFEGMLLDTLAEHSKKEAEFSKTGTEHSQADLRNSTKEAVSKLRSMSHGSLDRVSLKLDNLMITLQHWPSSGYFTYKKKPIDPTQVYVWCDRLLNHTMLEIDAKSTHTIITTSLGLSEVEATNLLLRQTVASNGGNAANAFDSLEKALPFIMDELKLGSKRFYSRTPTPADVLFRCNLVLSHLKAAKTPFVNVILEADKTGNTFTLNDFVSHLQDKGILFTRTDDGNALFNSIKLSGRMLLIKNDHSFSVEVRLEDLVNYTLLLATEDSHEAHVLIRTLAEKIGHVPSIYRNFEKNPVELVSLISIYPHDINESGRKGTESKQVRVPLSMLNGHNLESTGPVDLESISQPLESDNE